MQWDWFTDADYWASRLVFQRMLALVYLVAFLVAVNQFRALLGEHGLLPVPRFLRAVPLRRSPSIFRLHYSDRFFAVVAWTGAAVSVVLLLGLTDSAPVWLSMLTWTLPWVLYLSIVNVGQLWYSFGWESLLLETGFLAIFLGPADTAPPVLVLWLLLWLLFRVEFGAGLIKLRGDRCWRDLTCLKHHHETQPMPGPLSWYFHHLSPRLHKVEVLANHFAQLVVPFALFAPQPVASVAAGVVVVTQLWLMVSGNFSWLNLITITLALSAMDDSVYGWLLGGPPATTESPVWHHWLVLALTVLVAVLSYWPVRNLIGKGQLMNYSFTRLHLVNTYGAFGSITRTRYEIVIAATDDAEPAADTVWREYEFKGKPGDPQRRPRQIAPYHLRLDWQMWFAAMSSRYAESWMPTLARKLLEADPTTLKLFRHVPFGADRPAFLRATLYHYRFTTPQERRDTGAWWVREEIGPAVQTCRLDADGEPIPVLDRD